MPSCRAVAPSHPKNRVKDGHRDVRIFWKLCSDDNTERWADCYNRHHPLEAARSYFMLDQSTICSEALDCQFGSRYYPNVRHRDGVAYVLGNMFEGALTQVRPVAAGCGRVGAQLRYQHPASPIRSQKRKPALGLTPRGSHLLTHWNSLLQQLKTASHDVRESIARVMALNIARLRPGPLYVLLLVQ